MLLYQEFSRARALASNQAGAPKLRAVYGTLGDAHLQKKVLDAVLAWCLPDADSRDFNLDVVDGETAGIAQLSGLCSNLPFLSDYRAIVVQHAQKLEGLSRAGEDEGGGDAPKSKGKAGLSPAKRLQACIGGMAPSTVLILMRSPEAAEAGARASVPRCINAAVDKTIEQHGQIIDCSVSPKNAILPTLVINEEAAAHGIALERGAAEHLVARVGHDITNLLSELEKCALRAGRGGTLTRAIIDEMTRPAPQDTIFDLADAVGTGQSARALGLVRELMDSGEAPEMLLSMLCRHLRQLLQARTFLDARLTLDSNLVHKLPPELAAQLPQSGADNLATLLQSQSWRANKLTPQARNFTVPQLQCALQEALSTDLALKGIEGDGGPREMLLELLIYKLCELRQPATRAV